MPVPLLDLTRQNEPLLPELLAKTEEVLRSGRYILGEEVSSLEVEAASALEAERSLAVSSGTDALLLALMAAGIGPGDEVIVPDFTFFATAGCVARVGARPVFADICPCCYLIRPESIRERITPKTKAIVPVHLFGQAADMSRIMGIAEEHGLTVIEDCAQSIGARHKGKTVGTLGHYGAISFFPTKNLGGFGDGGLLLSRDSGDFDRAKILRVHGMEPKYHHPMIGGNFRMDALQAALLRIKLPHLESYNRGRANHAAFYLREISAHPGTALPAPSGRECGDSCPCPCDEPPGDARILLPFAYSHNSVTWNQFTLRIRGTGRRDAFRTFLSERGIGNEIYYPVALSDQECFRSYDPAPCPGARRVADECVSIPVFPELREDERSKVAKTILEWLEGKS